MISGNDEISIKALDLLNDNSSVKDVANIMGITIDQVKKLSQLSKMYEDINIFPVPLQEKFKALGLKALVLRPLFKDKDMDGLKEILESIDVGIKRDELKLLPESLKLKREEVNKAKRRAELEIQNLADIEKETEDKIKELEANKKKIDESLSFLKSVVSQKAKEFLLEHIGVAKGKLVLYQRLDISWQQALKNKGVIRYNNTTYTWIINDIEELVNQVERRIKNKNNMYYDPSKATGIYADRYPDDPVYKNAQGLNYSIMEEIKNNEKELKELHKKKRKINKSIKELKSTKVQTYLSAAEVSNQLSQKEILEHMQLQNAGMRYLYTNGYVAVTELTKDNYRFDVIGYDEDNCIIIIEAKASTEDFRRDIKFQNYTQYCNKLYFIFKDTTFRISQKEIENKLRPLGIGILVSNKDTAELAMEGINTSNTDSIRRNDLIFMINRALCRKYIYGR